jgi:hypothetical protein
MERRERRERRMEEERVGGVVVGRLGIPQPMGQVTVPGAPTGWQQNASPPRA